MIIMLGTCFFALGGCAGRPASDSSNRANSNVSPSPQPTVTPEPAPLKPKVATLSADPNPIRVCDGSGLGITTLKFAAEGPTAVELGVGSPKGVGGVLAHSAPHGSAQTGKWVNDGLVFYLQDASAGKAPTPENTLATVTVRITNAGCP